MKILALDTGTTQTGYCIMDMEKPELKEAGKTDNDNILCVIAGTLFNKAVDVVVYEEFESFGMAIGKETMRSIWWNGRYYQEAEAYGKEIKSITRRQEKLHLCNSVKAKDCNIRQALIDKYGKVGTKKNPGFFYGVSGDMWSAIAVAVTYYETEVKK